MPPADIDYRFRLLFLQAVLGVTKRQLASRLGVSYWAVRSWTTSPYAKNFRTPSRRNRERINRFYSQRLRWGRRPPRHRLKRAFGRYIMGSTQRASIAGRYISESGYRQKTVLMEIAEFVPVTMPTEDGFVYTVTYHWVPRYQNIIEAVAAEPGWHTFQLFIDATVTWEDSTDFVTAFSSMYERDIFMQVPHHEKRDIIDRLFEELMENLLQYSPPGSESLIEIDWQGLVMRRYRRFF